MSAWVGIGRSDVGLVRTSNQDAFAAIDRLGLWTVADGMGGHAGGEIAAQTAINTIRAQAELSAESLQQGHITVGDFMTALIVRAHDAILERAKREPTLKGMGTTIVMLTIVSSPHPAAHVAHLGDSRAYRYRSGILTPLTKDHTLIEKYVAHGLLSQESARTHPERHVLTHALGMPSPVKPDVTSFPLQQEDVLLLCSDGLTKMLEDHDIRVILFKAKGDPVRASDQLIAESLARGGEDNVTVVVVARP